MMTLWVKAPAANWDNLSPGSAPGIHMMGESAPVGCPLASHCSVLAHIYNAILNMFLKSATRNMPAKSEACGIHIESSFTLSQMSSTNFDFDVVFLLLFFVCEVLF